MLGHGPPKEQEGWGSGVVISPWLKAVSRKHQCSGFSGFLTQSARGACKVLFAKFGTVGGGCPERVKVRDKGGAPMVPATAVKLKEPAREKGKVLIASFWEASVTSHLNEGVRGCISPI
jgi:hypothetical protein